MTVVVTGKCDSCRFTDCVTVCPVACFHGDDNMVYVDPGECIDCSACVAVCPVHAIYELRELPADMRQWIEINAKRAPKLPPVTEKQTPLATAEEKRAALGY